jgi:DNA-nicking Smr family endonuclease
MSTDSTSLDTDLDLFREIVGEVKPVPQQRAEPHHPRPKPQPRFTREAEQRVMIDALSDAFEPDEHETGEELLYCGPGVQQSTFRKLRRGQIIVRAELDLHGLTSAEARPAVAEFLQASRRLGIRCVRIIHGKGLGSRHRGPVLKTKLNIWLRQREEVLAFASARPVDGGTGAVYVLLRRG